jgi:hypothetical protein
MEFKQLSIRIDSKVYDMLTQWHLRSRISKTVGVELALKEFIARHPDGVSTQDLPNRS